MRLLNTATLKVEEFIGGVLPEYAILSHTWETEEVSFQDIQTPTAAQKKGYTKIQKCCKRAREDGYKYCWIDTCCIDKTSSAELSEAINSMYRYYQQARVCYVYLSDLREEGAEDQGELQSDLRSCRWWTRGWTLQELIAPQTVEFYDSGWTEIGTKLSLDHQIMQITGIDEGVLGGENPHRRNVAVRMSWAARRTTTRLEDRAYSLMGIFGVNMSLIYGEGCRAFIRLQEEILRSQEDHTIFAWCTGPFKLFGNGNGNIRSILADSPSCFNDHEWMSWYGDTCPSVFASYDQQPLAAFHPSRYKDLHPNFARFRAFMPPTDYEPPRVTSRGFRISLPLWRKADPGWETVFERSVKPTHLGHMEHIACLTTITEQGEKALLCAWIEEDPESGLFTFSETERLFIVPGAFARLFVYRTVYIIQPETPSSLRRSISFMPRLVIVETTSPLLESFFHYQSPTWVNLEELTIFRKERMAGKREDGLKQVVPHWRGFQLGMLSRDLVDLKDEDVPDLVLGYEERNCWFTQRARVIVPGANEIDGRYEGGKTVEIRDCPLNKDRVTGILPGTSPGHPNIEIKVSIREIATGPLEIRRNRQAESGKGFAASSEECMVWMIGPRPILCLSTSTVVIFAFLVDRSTSNHSVMPLIDISTLSTFS
ncbi:HET-domain-containing protein [Amniculicola lignicola CBS 123094]|uniref:HET-domain-containing protein n=1 Tax=Amniculicola lignicola CBS 123094 TaxID=1392246 RepID=A0A6A5VWY4_9PLEO|nr:HET-domain-containing protein [Amniculicola lignicola CBS 123094]